MKINRRSKRFHDPWGNRRGNDGSPVRYQWLVGDKSHVNGSAYYADRIDAYEATGARYVLGETSIEKIRK